VSEEIKALVAQAQLAPNVHLLGGLQGAAVADWLRAADFAVQPSHFEAMGLAAAEAMAAGLPVIATDTGGYKDFIVHEQNGLLVPVGDVDALGQAIVRLTDDAALRKQLASAARRGAEPFDERRVLEQFAAIVDRLAAER